MSIVVDGEVNLWREGEDRVVVEEIIWGREEGGRQIWEDLVEKTIKMSLKC